MVSGGAIPRLDCVGLLTSRSAAPSPRLFAKLSDRPAADVAAVTEYGSIITETFQSNPPKLKYVVCQSVKTRTSNKKDFLVLKIICSSISLENDLFDVNTLLPLFSSF